MRGNARTVEVDVRKFQKRGSRREKMSEVRKGKKCAKTRDRNAT